MRNAQNTGVTQTLVLQILTSLTTISTLSPVSLEQYIDGNAHAYAQCAGPLMLLLRLLLVHRHWEIR